jgi:hypothetical protein
MRKGSKEVFKEILFQLEPWKIGTVLLVFGLSIFYVIFRILTKTAALVNWQLLGLYVALVFVLTVSRMARFTSVGLRFSYFVLFFITITLGPLPAVVLRLLSVPLPFKSFLKTRETNLFKQVLYSGVSIGVIGLAVNLIGLDVITSNLVFYYLILYGSWVGLLVLIRLIFPMKRVPLTKYLASTGVALVFNWWLVKMFGAGFYVYLMGFV